MPGAEIDCGLGTGRLVLPSLKVKVKVSLGKEVPSKFWKSSGPESGYRLKDLDWITLAEFCVLRVLLLRLFLWPTHH